MRGSSTVERQGGVRSTWLVSRTAVLLGVPTLHMSHVHLSCPLLRAFDFDLIFHSYEQRLKRKVETNRVTRNEKLVDSYPFGDESKNILQYFLKAYDFASKDFRLPLGFKQQNDWLLLAGFFLSKRISF